MKKGDIAIQYVFLIFIAVIAVFVIVGMLSKWAFGANTFMCKLAGDCDSPKGIEDEKTITVNSIASFKNEIIKHAKLCYTVKSRDPGESGELCYTVKCCDTSQQNCPPIAGCTATCDNDMINRIQVSLRKDASDAREYVECSEFQSSNKAIIEYDFTRAKVIIK